MFSLLLLQGVLEEHNLLQPSQISSASGGRLAAAHGGMVSRLVAEKRIFRDSIKQLVILPHAERLAALSKGGYVVLCGLDAFECVPIPHVKTATTLAATTLPDPNNSGQHRSRLAMAVNTLRNAKVIVFDVLAGPAGTAPGGLPASFVGSFNLQVCFKCFVRPFLAFKSFLVHILELNCPLVSLCAHKLPLRPILTCCFLL